MGGVWAELGVAPWPVNIVCGTCVFFFCTWIHPNTKADHALAKSWPGKASRWPVLQQVLQPPKPTGQASRHAICNWLPGRKSQSRLAQSTVAAAAAPTPARSCHCKWSSCCCCCCCCSAEAKEQHCAAALFPLSVSSSVLLVLVWFGQL